MHESLKSKFSLIHFACNLMIGYSKTTTENNERGALDRRNKKLGLKCNPGLALTGVCTTGPGSQNECRKFSFFLFF